MTNNRNAATWALAASQFALAAALTWFGLALWWSARDLPEVAARVERSVDRLQPLVSEVKGVREQVPAVLAEVKAARESLPDLLNTVNAAVAESAAIRAALPEILEEVRKTREALPPMLDKAEHIVSEARGISQAATTGAITGALTGVVQAPVAIVGAMASLLIGEKDRESLGLDESDYPVIDEHIRKLLASSDKSSAAWRNPANGHAGVIEVVSRTQQDGRPCVRLRVDVLRESRRIRGDERVLCVNGQGQWQLHPENDTEEGD